MIIKRLKYLAVCLLVLLNVVSTMGGNNYKYYNSHDNSSLCLSFKNNKLTDSCRREYWQQIYVHKTGPSTGIFHIKDYRKILCYNEKKNKFKLLKRNNSSLALCQHARRHPRRHRRRHRRRGGRSYKDCTLTEADKYKLKSRGCELHENFGAGYAYISFKKDSLYLSLRKGRVQKHRKRGNILREPKKGKKFVLMSESQFANFWRA